jgi:hypothetical protein
VREATDPATPATQLSALSKYTRLRPLVAANPNTPIATLLRLASDHPREVLANPAWPLHLLANPALADDLPEMALVQILHLPKVPAFYVAAARKQWGSVIRDVITDYVALQGADCPDWEAHALMRLHNRRVQMAFRSEEDFRTQAFFRAFLGMHPLPLWMLQALAGHRSSEVRACIALHPDTPDALRKKLLRDDGVQFELSRPESWNTPEIVPQTAPLSPAVAALYDDKTSPEVIAAIAAPFRAGFSPAFADLVGARFIKTTTRRQNTKRKLTSERAHEVRAAIDLVVALYGHPLVSDAIKSTIFSEINRLWLPYQTWLWRLGLLSMAGAPAEALTLGATSYDWLDRYAVARHPATPHATLQDLAANDVNRIVRAAAAAALSH